MRLKKLAHAHTVYKTQYHIVWVTRFRKAILAPKGIKSYLKIKLKEINKYYPDWEYKEIGVKKDHVHIYIVTPPKYAVSYAVETIKKNTSRHLRKKFQFLQKVYWDGKGIWGAGYFVSTVGMNEKVIRRYVEMQEREDTGQAELEL